MLSDVWTRTRADKIQAAGLAINPLDMDLLCTTPRLMSDVSAWVQHIPFAFAMVQMIRPRTIVELGTHKGDSYCAMCQAVDMLGLDTRCTAVDTWKGDPQCGPYDGKILRDLRAHHDPRYGRFSTLLPSTFDKAAAQFPDGSIDLLHLDGLHRYGAVRHDFETWLPKLSKRAVVLMHDTHVRSGDFGVYRLWDELRDKFPSFAFEHGCGLGVLGVGHEVPPELGALFAARESAATGVQELFRALGERLELRRGLALLAADIAAQEGQANAWRTLARQPLRATLPPEAAGATTLGMDIPDLKRLIAALHETSLNQLGDLLTIAADNHNLRRACVEIRNKLAAVHRQTGPSTGDVAADVGIVMATLEDYSEKRARTQSRLVELQQVVDSLLEERRLHRSNDLAALIVRAVVGRGRSVVRGARLLLRAAARWLVLRLGRPKILRVSRRLPPF